MCMVNACINFCVESLAICFTKPKVFTPDALTNLGGLFWLLSTVRKDS